MSGFYAADASGSNLIGEGWEGLITSHELPVEVYGTVDGLEFFFTARFLSYTFCVADSGIDPHSIYLGDADGYYLESTLDMVIAGTVTAEGARLLIEGCISAYRSLECDIDESERITIPAPVGSEHPTFRPEAATPEEALETLYEPPTVQPVQPEAA